VKREKEPVVLRPLCQKCGASTPEMRLKHGEVRDVIACKCRRCSFEWTEIPLDQRTEKEKANL